MGASGSTYEEDDETIAVMKGVRLTDNVINRMRGGSTAASTQSPPTSPEPSLPAQMTAPLPSLSAPGDPLRPPMGPAPPSPPPSVEPAPPFPPPPSVELTPHPPPPPSMESAPLSSHPPFVESASFPMGVETLPPSPSLLPLSEHAPSTPPPPSVVPAPPSPLAPPPSVNLAPSPIHEHAPSSLPSPPLSVEPPPPPVEHAPSLLPASEEPVPPAPFPVVSEEGLCRTIALEQELQKGLEQHMSPGQLEVHQRVEQEVQTEVGEKSVEENLKESIPTDCTAAQDHRLRAHLYAHQLEQRVRELKKQDALYREQVAKLELKGKRFYSAITESYQKASREVSAKLRNYQINPVCADLQREIQKCYRENLGHTLSCSKIASLYLQCVSDARQNKTRPGD